MRNMNDLNRILADREGLKHQLTIADIAEVSGHISELMASSPEVIAMLVKNGCRRLAKQYPSKRKKRKRRS